jgi:prepilin peptidase CpaA
MSMTVVWFEPWAVILAGYVALLLAAAVIDSSSFRIPNWLTGPLGVLFVVAALVAERELDWIGHIAAGLAVFTVGTLFFHRGWLGGGDVKLMAAGALWLGLDNLLPYLAAVSILGGILTVTIMLVRVILANAMAVLGYRSGGSLPAVLLRGERIPYGVAIAAGSLFMLDRLPFVPGS